MFAMSFIADHTESCCDVWIGEVAAEESVVEECLHVEAEPPPDVDHDLKEVLSSLVQNMPDKKAVRLKVCRKHLWTDYK